ncbi:ParB/RepB/Spo0J family partition protein [Gemmobacter sp.]|uniref:ParB/RepB/Spo0J family partition protein n=1 Tax=Gemmobacter sp. TaxID=1898957 RepID=UPI002AFFF765|nr:ParB N-terminal domain-containing protein [Gemmobacter sp.]
MARRRLPPPPASDEAAMTPDLETKALFPPGLTPGFARPPVARVAAEAAAESALREVSAELAALRAEGRVVLRLPLAAIEEGWLIRDRLVADPEDLAVLTDSLRAHGQRTPIEVAELGPGRYGLISGWRRLVALRALATEETRFDSVLALVRAPETSADAYVAMVEENEIRAGLSYWERARVVARAVAGGVFGSEKIALQRLFASASRAKRSKIGSFLGLVQVLDGSLRFPADLPERLGLALAGALAADPGLRDRLVQALASADPQDAAGEQAVLARVLAGPRAPAAPAPARFDIAPGLWGERGRDGRLVLGGAALSESRVARLQDWLKADLRRR